MDPYIDIEFQPPEETQQPNAGLLRFRSAPSSLFANFMDTLDRQPDNNHHNNNNKAYNCNNQHSETFLSRFVSNGGGGDDSSSSSLSFDGLESKPTVTAGIPANDMQAIGTGHQLLPPQYPRQQLQRRDLLVSCGSGSVSMDTDRSVTVVNGSSINRQSSSPAGFFAHLNSLNGINGSGIFRGNGVADGSNPQNTGRLRGQIDFSKSSRRCPVGSLPRIPEVGGESIKDASGTGDVGFRNGDDQDDMRLFGSGFSFNSWSNDPTRLPGEIIGFRGDHKASYGSDASLAQNGEFSSPAPRVLSHQLSLPNRMDKLLPFQDTVPCKIRAKRGCATHPRSIAERARRTRISERMRRLQDLVPNMDKQMNTAEMLDLAVDYIKDLQRQHKSLCDLRSRCRCLDAEQLHS